MKNQQQKIILNKNPLRNFKCMKKCFNKFMSHSRDNKRRNKTIFISFI